MLRRLHSSGARIDHVNGEVRGIRFVHDAIDDLLFVAAERAQFLIGRFVVHRERGVVLHSAGEKDHELLPRIRGVRARDLGDGAGGALQRLHRAERLLARREADQQRVHLPYDTVGSIVDGCEDVSHWIRGPDQPVGGIVGGRRSVS